MKILFVITLCAILLGIWAKKSEDKPSIETSPSKTNTINTNSFTFLLDTNTNYYEFSSIYTYKPDTNILTITVLSSNIIVIANTGKVTLATTNLDAASLAFWQAVETMFNRLCPCVTNK